MPHLHWKRYSDTVQCNCTVFTVDRLSVEIVLVNKEFVQIIAVFYNVSVPGGTKEGSFSPLSYFVFNVFGRVPGFEPDN